MSNIFVLFHHPCSDGMGAKYAAWKKFGNNATYLGVKYEAVPKFPEQIKEGDEVYILDFSYPKEILRFWYKKLKKLVVLDHHKTAQEDLIGEPYATFDMNKSGAVLAWEYFHPNVEVPTLLQMIQDRDLWKWKLPGTRSILAHLELVRDDIETWDKEYFPLLGKHYSEGDLLVKQQDLIINRAVEEIGIITFRGYKVGIRNQTGFHSEIGNHICKRYPVDFSATYFIDKDGLVNWSFRSIGEFDVSKISKKYFGGGGHKNSAGGRSDLVTLKLMLEGMLSGPEF